LLSIESRSKQYGTIFGNWHIGRRLDDGANGKSAVFELYRDSNGWRECSALKVIGLIEERGSREKLTPHRQNEYSTAAREVRSSAEQEVRLMEQLRSQTHIVDYLDHSFFDWRDETGFGVDLLIRMELLNCLRTEMRAGRQFDDAEIIKIGKDICSALVLCHEKNIIHRDIKPENIFFNSNGDYKLGDFGISRIIKESPSAMASTGVGTPAYAAPEQSSGAYDKRVDIYSLGLVLYELCNGNRLPFARSSYVGEGEIRLRMSGTPLPLPGTPISGDPFMTHDANPSGNPDKTAAADPYATKKARHSEKLIRVIMKACAFRPEDRFATAQEMLDALMDKTPDPHPGPNPNPRPNPGPNSPKTFIAIAICTVLLVLAAGFFWWSRQDRPDPNPTPEPTLLTSGRSTVGTQLFDISYTADGKIVHLVEQVDSEFIPWDYVYDHGGSFLYRKKNIGDCLELQYESTETYPPSNGKLSICAFSSPVKNCVGFTVLYEVTKLSKGDFGGTRDMCIRLQEGTWKTVGSFAYDKMEKSTTAFSWIDPVDINAYCCPRQVTNGSWFSEKIYLTDIWVADYQYVELESNAIAETLKQTGGPLRYRTGDVGRAHWQK